VSSNDPSIGTMVVGGVICLGVLIGGGVGLDAGFSAYSRYQNIQSAHNKAQVNIINEQNTIEVTKLEEQNQANMIQVTKQKAQIQYQQAVGVRDADQEINKTLTPLYIQYLQIQAMEDMATSGKNNTVIYIPSGAGGIPVPTVPAGTGQ
jgi:hypothetical protein